MRRSYRFTAILFLAFTAILGVGLDFWKVHGRVLDAESGNSVSDAKVLVTLHAEEIRSPIPHAWTSKTRCVDVVKRTSDIDGRFKVWVVTWGLGLTNKKVAIDVFKPAWYGSN